MESTKQLVHQESSSSFIQVSSSSSNDKSNNNNQNIVIVSLDDPEQQQQQQQQQQRRQKRRSKLQNKNIIKTPRAVIFVMILLALVGLQTLEIEMKFPSTADLTATLWSDVDEQQQSQIQLPKVTNTSSELFFQQMYGNERPIRKHKISLDVLTRSNLQQDDCLMPTILMPNKVLSPEDDERFNTKRIPNIIHQTAKSRCLHMGFHHVIGMWRNMPKFHYYLHDDEAVWRLIMEREWPEFPSLKPVLKCISTMTAISDIWRYLVLWEYGGIYIDMDAAPTSNWTFDFILPTDDAFTVVEYYNAPSQYFMAMTPRHPLMYYSVLHALDKVSMFPKNAQKLDASLTTGPFALLDGFTWFMLDAGKLYEKPVAQGMYVGTNGRSVHILGHAREDADNLIKREYIGRRDKLEMYKSMNMSHFMDDRNNARKKEKFLFEKHIAAHGSLDGIEKPWTCLDHIHNTTLTDMMMLRQRRREQLILEQPQSAANGTRRLSSSTTIIDPLVAQYQEQREQKK